MSEIENLIRGVLATETSALRLSEQLFSPHGLFTLLARTKEERKKLVETPLFQEANARLTELQLVEAEPLFKEVDRIRAACAAKPVNGALHPVANPERARDA